jgi:hypothetical protein
MYEDFYNEGPSDYELFMNDLKETLKKSIKDEFIKEMDRLRAENKKLQNVKENFEQIKLDYAHKEQELIAREQDMEKNLARKKIMELATIADMKAQIYYIDDDTAYLPKCDKCDENRLIHFKSPTGKDCTEPCPDCGTTYHKYYVKPVDTMKILFPNDPAIRRVAYYLRHDRWGETYSYDLQDIYRGSAADYDASDGYKMHHTAFESKELAQEICDRINKERGIPENAEVKPRED